MRVLVAAHTFPKLSETFILNQITGLLDRGHDVTIWAQGDVDTEKFSHEAVEDYQLRDRVISKPVSGGPAAYLWKTVSRVLRNEHVGLSEIASLSNPAKYGLSALSMRMLHHFMAVEGEGPFDVVHAHFGPVGRVASILRDQGVFSCPIIVSFHGHDVHAHLRERGGDLYDDMFEKIDCITVNSNHVGEKVRELGGRNLVRHPVGLDPQKFPANFEQPDDGEPVELLTVARLTPKKGLKYSIRAVARSLEAGENIRYRIIGEGDQRSELEALISELGVGDSIELAGAKRRSEVAEAMADSHVFILTSVTPFNGDLEGQGLVIQEAQASGLPVITSWSGGIPEGVIPGETALMAPPRDVETIAEHIATLANDPGRRVAMGEKGTEFVEEEFDIDKLNDRLVEIYRDVANEAGRR